MALYCGEQNPTIRGLAPDRFFIPMSMQLLSRSHIDRIWLALLLATPIVLWLLPSDYFDSEDGVILCPSRLFFDVECFGCGMTRAVMHMHHLEISDALFFNYGVVAIYPAMVILWGHWTLLALRSIGVLPPLPPKPGKKGSS